MICRIRIVATALLLLALCDTLVSVHGELTLKELMEQDKAAKENAALGIVATKPPPKSDTTGTPAGSQTEGPRGTTPKPKPKAAPAFAAPLQAPMMASGGGAAGSGGAALGTSAMIGIGVGVGVACLVAVGSVVGVLVLRRRKRQGTQLDKQKTYGGTE